MKYLKKNLLMTAEDYYAISKLSTKEEVHGTLCQINNVLWNGFNIILSFAKLKNKLRACIIELIQ